MHRKIQLSNHFRFWKQPVKFDSSSEANHIPIMMHSLFRTSLDMHSKYFESSRTSLSKKLLPDACGIPMEFIVFLQAE